MWWERKFFVGLKTTNCLRLKQNSENKRQEVVNFCSSVKSCRLQTQMPATIIVFHHTLPMHVSFLVFVSFWFSDTLFFVFKVLYNFNSSKQKTSSVITSPNTTKNWWIFLRVRFFSIFKLKLRIRVLRLDQKQKYSIKGSKLNKIREDSNGTRIAG